MLHSLAKVREKIGQYFRKQVAGCIRDFPTVDIIVPIHNAFHDAKKCIESVLSCTKEGMYRLVIIDDGSTDPLVSDYLEYLSQKGIPYVLIIRNPSCIGFLRAVNRGMALSRNDVLLLNSDTIVTSGWLQRLQRSAYSDKKIATVTPLSNNAAICSVPEIDQSNDLPSGCAPSDFAQLVLDTAHKLGEQHVSIPTAIGFCMFIKRRVLETVGYFDESFGKGYYEEIDFCMRSKLKGYRQIVDIATFVYHKGSASFNEAEKVILGNKNYKLLIARHPAWPDMVRDFADEKPLKNVRESLKKSIQHHWNEDTSPLKVGIDAQLLWRPMGTGTIRYISSLLDNIKALNKKNNYIVYGKPDDSEIPSGQFVRRYATDSLDILLDSEPIDLIHRTSHCFSVHDLMTLLKAKCSVITILDLIFCKYPSYFSSHSEHERYMQLMGLSLRVADRVIAISHDSMQDIIKTFGVSEDKIDVIYPGFSGCGLVTNNTRAKNWIFPNLRRGKYLLYVGTDYPHKNHDTLIQAFKRLVNRTNINVKLVIAGPSISQSRRQEITSLIADIKERAVLFEYVDDEVLKELYRGAVAYVCPSLYEGFGFTPLEAMAHGIPVVASKATSIPEVVGEGAFLVDAENIDELSTAMYTILTDVNLRNRLIEKGWGQINKFSWRDTALKTLRTYDKAWKTATENQYKKDTAIINDLVLNYSGLQKLDQWVRCKIAGETGGRNGNVVLQGCV